MDISNITPLIKQLRAISSTNEKVEFVKQNLTLLRYPLTQAYDDFKLFKIKKFKNSYPKSEVFPSFESCLLFLEEKESVNNEDITKVYNTIHFLASNDDELDVLKGIIFKDLSIGMNKKLLIKAGIPLKIFNIQQAERQNKLDMLLEKIDGNDEVLVNIKYDGKRLITVVNNGQVTFFSRNGKEYICYDSLKPVVLNATENLGNCILDGEIMSITNDFHKLTQFSVKKDNDLSEMYYAVFDIMMLQGMDIKHFSQRKRFDVLISNLKTSDNLQLAEYWYIEKNRFIDEYNYLFEMALDRGYEGLIIKNPNAPYEEKRSINWIKVKPCDNIDLEVVDMYEGKGSYVGTMGGVNVKYEDSLVGVGSGFTKKERDYYWQNPNEILGKIIEISFMEETHTGSLRLPIFKKVRNDKS